ncbi:hypothetical protein OG698_15700 [Streptomyces sp. NBC_01003]|uniref:hypothetical protein n=1 Tax=Streptomyces sp. NBC_01003 TaxID=2903714 RepID=UPI003867A28D|nr:hypothetical protein OG698_15700 [Streptomyces sp. NBC_01003]
MFAAAACTSSSGRDYAVPQAACGVQVGSEVLSPLLPDGKKLTQRDYNFGPTQPRCELKVDGNLVVHVSGDVVPASTDVIAVNERGMRGLGHPAAAKNIGQDARIADRGALTVDRCVYGGKQQKFVADIELKKQAIQDVSERRDALRSLLKAYLPAAMKDVGCS